MRQVAFGLYWGEAGLPPFKFQLMSNTVLWVTHTRTRTRLEKTGDLVDVVAGPLSNEVASAIKPLLFSNAQLDYILVVRRSLTCFTVRFAEAKLLDNTTKHPPLQPT